MTCEEKAPDCPLVASATAPCLSGGAWSGVKTHAGKVSRRPSRIKGSGKMLSTHNCSTIVVSMSLFCRNCETTCSSKSGQSSTVKSGEQRRNVNRRSTAFRAQTCPQYGDSNPKWRKVRT